MTPRGRRRDAARSGSPPSAKAQTYLAGDGDVGARRHPSSCGAEVDVHGTLGKARQGTGRSGGLGGEPRAPKKSRTRRNGGNISHTSPYCQELSDGRKPGPCICCWAETVLRSPPSDWWSPQHGHSHCHSSVRATHTCPCVRRTTGPPPPPPPFEASSVPGSSVTQPISPLDTT